MANHVEKIDTMLLPRETFLSELRARQEAVNDYLSQTRFRDWGSPEHVRRAVFSYVSRPSKRLRPAVLLLACGAAGGREEQAIPAAAGVELFHTWTLVHDDLIDNDELRRGKPTVHAQAREWARAELGYSDEDARDYGRDICVLTGDVQQGLAVCMFLECARRGVRADIVIRLTELMESFVMVNLCAGEALDVQFSKRDFDTLDEDQVVEMMRLKTGVLYEFAGLAGASIGSGSLPEDSAVVRAIAQFTGRCGTAFQLQDDILGIVATEDQLGKPVGSDVREGKRTVIALRALANASVDQRAFLLRTVGNRQADDPAIEEAKRLFVELGGVSYARDLARRMLGEAMESLSVVPDSDHRRLLAAWADYMIERTF